MSGHSKWHSIKHAKVAADAARGKVFARLARQIEVAARSGGGDPEANPSLRAMMQKARDASMPKDNIERAIKRGTGELEGVRYEQVSYEGYAPNGVAVIAECLTDNRNRTGQEVKNIFTRNGGVNFAAIPCLNDSDAGMTVINALVTRELRGWTKSMVGLSL